MSSIPMPAMAGTTWETATLESVGFAPDLGERLEAGYRSGLLRGLHAVLLSRNGRLVLERYFSGPDESWGRPLGAVTFGPDVLHDLRSVTKSITGLLYGIALSRRLVPPPEAPLLAQFPQYPDLIADPDRTSLRVEHALTMSLGTEWNEGIPYSDPANSEIAMEHAPDRLRFVLDRRIIAKPGERWGYNGGATALLGALIAKGSGMSLPDFARETLFTPLGITRFEWAAGQDGIHSAASGLRLLPRDLARIGELVLAGGRWADRQIVPQAWIESSHKPAIPTGDGLHYGRQWFLGEAPVGGFAAPPRPWIGAFGNGGQRLWLMPSARVNLTILAGNYNAPDAWIFPTRVWREIVLPNLRAL